MNQNEFKPTSFVERVMPHSKPARVVVFGILDIIACVVASFMGLWLRFDFSVSAIPEEYWRRALYFLPIYIVITLICFWANRLYKYMWSVAGLWEMFSIFFGVTFVTIFQVCGFHILGWPMPRSFYLLTYLVLMISVILNRFSYRIVRSWEANWNNFKNRNKFQKIMIVGAGMAGSTIVNEIKASDRLYGDVLCFVDDNKQKQGRIINGIPIEGGREDIPKLVEKYGIDEIFIALPSAKTKDRRDIISICQETDTKVKILPAIYQLVNGEVSVSKLREVQVEDLLGRDQIQYNVDEVAAYIKDKVVLVTGGGGSIGSELCRQIIKQDPKMLVVLDIYENTAYDLQQELKYHYPDKDIRFVIGSVRDLHRLDVIFEKYHPQLVFHAAAHKHVPLMEHSPNEAIKNNVFGTYNVALTAEKYEVEKFVLISTDKAVNPTNIMGASKRICEMIVQTMAKYSKTTFVAVRFGNVLGSHGSVIPLFEKQIKAGGPVTVTHPDIIRFFMTIPEAVGLVLQAGAYANGGEIFVLDMGEPMKILDLAKNMIRMSGYIPDEDIKIEFTGLRPGEKLYEETLMDEEGLQDTANHMIHIGKPIQLNEEVFFEQLRELREATRKDLPSIKEAVANIVPTYTPQNIKPKGEKEL